jgi:hypothetical protein
MFWFTSVQVLSVVNIAPGSGGAGSALGARYNPAAITAVNVNNLKVGFILILGFTFYCFLLAVFAPDRAIDAANVKPAPRIVWHCLLEHYLLRISQAEVSKKDEILILIAAKLMTHAANHRACVRTD